ncbi:MAG: sensor histidine kinase, partial [bacterium]
MNLFEISRKSPERVWKLMQHLNFLILLYITVISYHAILGMARSNSALLFLKTIPVLPMESMRFAASVFMLYAGLIILFRLDMEDEGLNLVKLVLEIIVSVMLCTLCGMAYTGILILVMTDIIHGCYSRQKKLRYLIPVIVLYMVVDSKILNLWLRNVSFSDYLVFYNPRAAGILQSILNTLQLVNIVMFIIFLVVTLRYQMDKTERIMRLNEELTVANIKLEEYSRKSAEMAQMQERNRLAREIHDTIGHALTGIVTGLEACFVLLETRPDLAGKQIKAIQNVARKGMKDVRSSVRALR